MIRFNHHSQFGYDTFPDLHPIDGQPYVNTYQDNACIGQVDGIAFLFEPKSMIGPAYDYVEQYSDNFTLIFTHDSEILKKNNAYYFNWGDVWLTTDSPKTKGISIVSSWKDWCPLHKARISLAKLFEMSDKVDVYGTYNDPSNKEMRAVPPETYLENYKFSIILENDIDDLWFTEKILNCFSTKTVPIYLGARKIGDIFNDKGIIQVNEWMEIPSIVNELDIDSYESYLPYINDNFERVKEYTTPWDKRFFKAYTDVIEGIYG